MNNQTKLEQAKRKVDAMMGLPNVMIRKGVARSGDALTGFTDYNFKLIRDENKKWLFYCEWVDLDGEGFRIVLPHSVVEAMLRGADGLIKQSRKEGAKKAVQTRKAKGNQSIQEIIDQANIK